MPSHKIATDTAYFPQAALPRSAFWNATVLGLVATISILAFVERAIAYDGTGAVDVMKLGCVGDNQTDDTSCLNSAISIAHSNCGVVFLPSGFFRIKSPLRYQSCVSIRGNGRRSSMIVWRPESDMGGTVLNLTNQNINGVTFSNFGLSNDRKISAAVDAIVGGSSLKNYNSAVAVFENLYIAGFRYGLAGIGETAVGLFDSTFKDIWLDQNEFGFAPYGSQNTVINPRLTRNIHGYYLGFLSGESTSGVQTFGGVFASNTFDVTIPNREGIRPTLFKGTWFEGAKEKILNIHYANTLSKGLSFEDCTLQSNSETAVLDFSNLIGLASLSNCNLVQTSPTQSTTVLPPKSLRAKLSIRDNINIDYRGNFTLRSVDGVQ